MNTLPSELQQLIFEYDMTYHEIFKESLKFFNYGLDVDSASWFLSDEDPLGMFMESPLSFVDDYKSIGRRIEQLYASDHDEEHLLADWDDRINEYGNAQKYQSGIGYMDMEWIFDEEDEKKYDHGKLEDFMNKINQNILQVRKEIVYDEW